MKPNRLPATTPVLPFVLAVLLGAFLPARLPAQEAAYQEIRAEAERHHAEGSYARAHELYQEAQKLELSPAAARWVEFRLADTMWRAQAATRTPDPSRHEAAQKRLAALLSTFERVEDRDRVWAEAHESLGDFHWTRPDSRNWHLAWPHHQAALEFWAGSQELDLARDRYLRIVWTASSPPWREPYAYYGYYGNLLPLNVLENVLAISLTPSDRARAQHLVAMTLKQQGGDPWHAARVAEAFEATLKAGKAVEWYDDALYHYGEWLATSGPPVFPEDGPPRQEPDYVKALELFRRLLSEFKKGETKYWDQALNQVRAITTLSLAVAVPHATAPGGEVQYHLVWRNVERIELALYPVDLTRDVDLSHESARTSNWIQTVSLEGRERVRSWTKETGDRGDHRPGAEVLRLEGKLPAGAYVLEARVGTLAARDLVLVTDAVLVLKSSGRRALVYFTDSLDGAPLAGAEVSLWEGVNDGRGRRSRKLTARTDTSGLASFDLLDLGGGRELFAAAASGARQAFATGQSQRENPQGVEWRIYAFTDRPAFRPGEKVEWKAIARRRSPGSAYTTPAGETLSYQVTDPRGAKAAEGTVSLNEFGSAWGSLEVTAAMPLGQYTIHFWVVRGQTKTHAGQAPLFRLEEYKLPEFRVAIEMPREDGRRKVFRLGDRVEASVAAEYYFGGPVADATVEVVVHQTPYFHYWEPAGEHPWLLEDFSRQRWGWHGGSQVVKRETLRTDAQGRAAVFIETPRGQHQDLEYRIEARVTDSSRREVVGTGTVRVTRDPYFVQVKPEHNLHHPGDQVRVSFKTLDANREPIQAQGSVQVTRDRWVEIWIAPGGKEVRGDELRRLRDEGQLPVEPGTPGSGWTLKFRGYEHEDVLTKRITTDAGGGAELSFQAPREGFYRIAYTGKEKGGPPVRGEATAWVLTGESREIGYRHGAVEVIVDRETFRPGQKAPVMLSAAAAGRHVLFTIEGEDILQAQVIHLEGRVKLLEVQVEEAHVPNVFLGAVLVADRQVHQDLRQAAVPPVRHFLKVEVKPDQEEHLPRDEGSFTVTALDHDGKPVQAEVAVSIADESVHAIQEDYAGDPRKFFFGTLRPHRVLTQASIFHKGFAPDPRAMRDSDDAKEFDELRDGQSFRGKREQGWDLGGMQKLSRLDAAGGPAAARAEGGMLEERLAVGDSEVTNGRNFSPPGEAPGQVEVVVRTDFRSTILWEPAVRTGPDGRAEVKVRFPDSLTRWRATARATTSESQVGMASGSARTRMPLLVRLQAPRFFVAGDRAVISAVIHNNTSGSLAVRPALEAEGIKVVGRVIDGKAIQGELPPVTIHGGSEARADWLVEASKPGQARLKASARSAEHADAMERVYPVEEHGVEKLLARAGKLRGESALVRLDLPAERRPGSVSLVVQAAPSLAVTLLDALPYLADYPYGCTEQTMSRFLPAVIVARTLKDLGLSAEAVEGKLFGGIEPASAGKVHPGRRKDLRKLEEMAQRGLERLRDFQHADGGWGWWKEGESDHWMTAYVVWGLALARGAGVDVPPAVVERGADWLAKEIVEEEDYPDLQAFMLHALAARHAMEARRQPGQFEAAALANLWKKRDALNAYTRALLALSAHAYGDADKARVLVRNLENGVKEDRNPDASVVYQGPRAREEALATAHWGEDGISWRWSEGGVEATAFALRALLAIEPGHRLTEPVVSWLVKNRRGAQWSNTRDTAIAVLALTDFLKKSGELEPTIEYEVLVNGTRVAERSLGPRDALSAPSRLQVDPALVRDGANEVRFVRRGGSSPLYFAVEARFFSREEPVSPAGNEIFVRREYQRLAPRPTLLKGPVEERLALPDEGRVVSGERVEVVLTVEAKNHLEYVVLEDLKPAGLEAVELQSGTPLYARELKASAVERLRRDWQAGAAPAPSTREDSDFTDRTRWVYQELRDRKVALFLDRLPEGVWEVRYSLRAEAPGKFHGLPVLAHAMYVPEIRANSAETRVEVEDRKPDLSRKLRRAVVEGGQ